MERRIAMNITGITLLTTREARQLSPHLLTINKCWWLKDKFHNSYSATIVNSFGYFYCAPVDSREVSVRPVIEFESEDDIRKFKLGGMDFEVIGSGRALCCDTLCCKSYYDKITTSVPSPEFYDKSDIKKYLEDWLFNALKSA